MKKNVALVDLDNKKITIAEELDEAAANARIVGLKLQADLNSEIEFPGSNWLAYGPADVPYSFPKEE